MKIRTQLSVFVFLILFFPILGFVAFNGFNYYNSTHRIVLKSYTDITKSNNSLLNSQEKELIEDAIASLPNEVEAALIIHNAVYISTIDELKEGTFLSDEVLWNIIRNTSYEYYYQFETPPLGSKDSRTMLISRISKIRKNKSNYLIRSLLGGVIFFIFFCAILIISISNSISNSLSILEKQTESMTNGDLETPVEDLNSSNQDNEITNLCQNLEKMRLSLLESRNMRSRFVMGISHDLRTPIAVIKGYTEALADGMYDTKEEINGVISMINSKANQLESMIDTIINYEKLTNKELYTKLKSHEIGSFLKNFAKTSVTTGTVFHKKVTSYVSLYEGTEVLYDEQLAQRALENLFSNALRYTKDGDSIHIEMIENDMQISVSFTDSGCGIDEKDIKHIFDLFYRGTNSRREEGMGIGLSVVKDILEIFKWKIDVKSVKDQGTTFTIIIPKN